MVKMFENIVSFFKRENKPQTQTSVNVPLVLTSYGYANTKVGISKPGASQRELLNAYRSWVFLCVTIRAEAVAKVRFRPFTENFKGKRVIVPSRHPAQQVLDNPNPYMTRWYFQFLVSAYLDLVGHAYAYIARDRMGVPRQLWLLPPDKVRVVPSQDTSRMIDRYILDIGNGKWQEFEAEEILHIKQPNPTSNYYGLSTTEAAAYFIDVNEGQQRWQNNLFEKGAMPDFVFMSEKQIDPKAREEFLQKWFGWFGGAEKKRRIGFLDNGTKVEAIKGEAAKDMEFSKQALDTRNNIFAMYRVPLSFAGIDESITARATAESMDYKFNSFVIEPRLQMIEGQLALDLLRVWFAPELALTHDNIIPGDVERMATVEAKQIESGTLTINEAREAQGKDPVEGGDEVLVKTSLTSLANAVKEKKDPPPMNIAQQNGDPNAAPTD